MKFPVKNKIVKNALFFNGLAWENEFAIFDGDDKIVETYSLKDNERFPMMQTRTLIVKNKRSDNSKRKFYLDVFVSPYKFMIGKNDISLELIKAMYDEYGENYVDELENVFFQKLQNEDEDIKILEKDIARLSKKIRYVPKKSDQFRISYEISVDEERLEYYKKNKQNIISKFDALNQYITTKKHREEVLGL